MSIVLNEHMRGNKILLEKVGMQILDVRRSG